MRKRSTGTILSHILKTLACRVRIRTTNTCRRTSSDLEGPDGNRAARRVDRYGCFLTRASIHLFGSLFGKYVIAASGSQLLKQQEIFAARLGGV